MRIHSAILLSILAAPAAIVHGQVAAAIAAPSLGLVFDDAVRAFRPISGIAGAALLGTPLASEVPLAGAVISPRQDYALVLSEADGQVRLARFQNETMVLRAVGVAPYADRIVLSPAGSSAALYYAGPGMIEVLSGLPDQPVVDRKVAASLAGGVTSPMAISDDGQLILTGNSDSLVLIRATGPIQLPMDGPVSAIAFRSHSEDAVITSQSGRISLIRAAAGQLTQEILADATGGLTGAVAVDFSDDGTQVYAVAADGAIAGLSLAEKTLVLLNCHCKVSGLHRLNGGAFRLNEPAEPPLLLLDTRVKPERVLFVPREGALSAPGASDTSRSAQ